MKRNPFLIFLAIFGAFFIFCMVAGFILIYSLFGNTPSSIRSDAIGVIKVTGIITKSEKTLKTIRKFKKEGHIKAVIIRLDSPGGIVGPSQEIYDAVKDLSRTKTVVASFGALAASGAYYIACGAETIVSNPGTLTGSIGVIMEFANLEKLYKWAKLDATIIKSGKYKDIGSPIRAMTADEKKLLTALVDNTYQQFRKVVQNERKIADDILDTVTDGRIFTGEQAKAVGLVDYLGNFEKAVEIAKNMAGIKGDPVLIYAPKEKRPFLKYILGDTTAEALEKLTLQHSMSAPLWYLMPSFR